jgi:hypothetical protein
MTEMTFYPPVESPWRQDGTGTPGPVQVAVAGPAAQRRATVAIRLILAIPHLLALSFLGIAAAVVAVIGWLGALVTGRLPRFAASYLSGYLRWYARAGAYLLLLTDEYPPFAFGDAAYPVRLAAGPGKLNRLTVLFRVILAIPAAIVLLFLTYGLMTIVIFTGWLTALISGRLPASLHQAFAAALRYTIRYYGYLYLLTGAYPAGLFGDKPAAPPEAGFTGQDASWRLALSPGAKRMVGLMLVLGLLTVAGEAAWAGATIHAARVRATEISQLDAAVARFNPVVARHNAAVARERQAASEVSNTITVLTNAHYTVLEVLTGPSTDSSKCSTESCFNATSRPGAVAFAAFGRTLRATHVPPGSAAITKRLIVDTADSERDWAEMATATSFSSGADIAGAAEKVPWDSDYAALMTSLGNKFAALGNEAGQLNTAATTLTNEGAALDRRAAALNVTVSVRTANPGS